MSERLARSAGLIAVATLGSRVLGLVRDMVQAALFATGHDNDAFVLATRIPTLLRDLFAEGAMSAAFVPTFTRHLTTGGKPAAWRLGSQVVNGLMVVTGGLVILGVVFATPLATAFAGPFAFQAPGKLDLTISLTRFNMPFLLLVAVAAACMGMLNALHRFFIPAVSPAMYNVVFIACAAGLTPWFVHLGIPPIMSLTAGMLIGGLAQIAAQWPALRREGYRHQWILDFRDPGLREVLVLMGPGTLGVAAAQVNVFVNTVLAAGEPHAPSALSYAFRFMYLPVGIFGVSVATAAIPSLARQAASAAYGDMRETLSWGLRVMLALSVPATVGLMVLTPSIVELIYERGHFTLADSRLLAASLFFYAPGIVGYSVVKIASPSFYALRDARTPVIVSVVTIVTNIGLNLWLNHAMGFRGLALGTAIAANVNAALLLFLLARRLGGFDTGRIGRTLLKIAVASAVMGAAAYYAEAGLHHLLAEPRLVPRLVRVGGGIGAGLCTLMIAAWLLRLEEFLHALKKTSEVLKLGSDRGQTTI
jgi:putative peptidoglycan lipid II flippase